MKKYPAGRLSDVLYWVTWACLLAMPLVFIVFASTGYFSASSAVAAFPEIHVSDELPPIRATAASGIGLVIWLLFGLMLWQTQHLFQLFRSGGALTEAAARRIRAIGALATALALMQVLVTMTQILILTSANPPGERVLALHVSSHEIGLIVFGGLLLAIGHVLTEAAAAVAENKEFV